jgi:hypothetical protein
MLECIDEYLYTQGDCKVETCESYPDPLYTLKELVYSENPFYLALDSAR